MELARTSLVELAVVFLRLGVTAFGGPAAHIALMEDEFVRRRRWLTHERFLDLLGAANLIPGPSSTELAVYIGYEQAGWRGLLLAGTCFLLPAALMVGVIAWAYVHFGTLPTLEGVLYGIKPVVIGVVVQALFGLAPRAVKRSKLLGTIVVGACVASALGVDALVVLLGSGVMTVAARRIRGYTLLAFLRADLVDRLHWLSASQLLDAVAVGQVTPGPVFTTATFIGYLIGGAWGAVLATIGIFLPGFVLVAATRTFIARLRGSFTAAAFLDGVNVASLALMAVVTSQLARAALVDIPTLLIAVGGALLLLRWKVNSTWLVAGAAVLGAFLRVLR